MVGEVWCIKYDEYLKGIAEPYIFWPKSRIPPPNLNNNWMTAMIGRSRHATVWTTFRYYGGGIQDLDSYFSHGGQKVKNCRVR